MQAYAPADEPLSASRFRRVDPALQRGSEDAAFDSAVVEALLSRVADLVADRLTARTADAKKPTEEWLDARAAATYLGIHRDTLRKLAAERVVPVHQDAPGCKLYFRRDELDEWRRSSRTPRSRLRVVS